MAKKKKSVVGQVFKWIGITLLVGLVVAVVCYFAIPEFKTFINNSWQDLKTQIENGKEATDGALEAAKHLIVK